MFSHKQNSLDGPEATDPTGDRAPSEEDANVITGEEVSLDTGQSADTVDLVGIAAAVAEVAEPEKEAPVIENFSVFDETVSLPTGKATPPAPAEAIVAETETIEESVARAPAIKDVLANRDLPLIIEDGSAAEAVAPTDDLSSEDTHVLRRSLLGANGDAASLEAESAVVTPGPASVAAASMATESVAVTPTGSDSTTILSEGISPHHDENLDSAMLIGATVLPSVSSKAPARWLSLILTIIFVPIAWYLLSDASARLTLAEGNPMTSGSVNFAALIELFAGIVFVALMGVMASYSSLGLLVTGSLVFLLGLPFLVMPAWSNQFIDQYFEGVRNFNDFGANVVAHVVLTGFTGVLVMTGLTMIIFGWVIAAVRRSGRREEAMRAMVAQVNPEGLQARWAKKATERDRQGK